MSPLRQPPSLLYVCVSSSSRIFASFSISKSLCGGSHEFEQWVHSYLKKFVPPVLYCDLLHCALHKLATEYKKQLTPDVISHLISLLLHPKINKLSLSNLTFGGSFSYETLDTFENMLSSCLISLPYLTHLDLSTHHSEVSMPSCSSKVLWTIGSHCPNLRHLNLNNNNRVTGEGLYGLYPSDYHPGCPLIEEMFIQDCSVTALDVAYLLEYFPCLRIVGYQDMGVVLVKLKKLRRSTQRGNPSQPTLKLTHIDNTSSTSNSSDGPLLKFISQTCPHLENVRLRVCDEDSNQLHKLNAVKSIELRFYTGVHHPIGMDTLSYLRLKGSTLSSLTLYCASLESHHITVLTGSCVNLLKLYLHANDFHITEESPFASTNSLVHLETVSIRIGQDEMDESPEACSLIRYILLPCRLLKEVYLLVRSAFLTHEFFQQLLLENRFLDLKTLICDAPRRNLSVPLLDLTIDTAFLFIHCCPSLQTLGNLICWALTQIEVQTLKEFARKRNLHLEIIHSQLNKKSKKYF